MRQLSWALFSHTQKNPKLGWIQNIFQHSTDLPRNFCCPDSSHCRSGNQILGNQRKLWRGCQSFWIIQCYLFGIDCIVCISISTIILRIKLEIWMFVGLSFCSIYFIDRKLYIPATFLKLWHQPWSSLNEETKKSEVKKFKKSKNFLVRPSNTPSHWIFMLNRPRHRRHSHFMVCLMWASTWRFLKNVGKIFRGNFPCMLTVVV